MSTDQTLEIRSSSLEETLVIGEKLGRNLKGGEVIELISDLGGGKTSFVKGLAKGFGSEDNVHSPSFTISNEYRSGEKSLHHFDFYRLSEAGIMNDELAELINDPNCVVAVEWGDIVHNVLPPSRLSVSIVAIGDNDRNIKISYPEDLSYVVEGVQ